MARNPLVEMMSFGLSAGMMLAEAQVVIGLRVLGAMGMWNLGPGEATRMWREKAEAARQSGAAVSSALSRGVGPVHVAGAALKPVRNKTRSNLSRLARLGAK